MKTLKRLFRETHRYWITDLPRRLDDWTSRFRENTGQPTDEQLERRRWKRCRKDRESPGNYT